MKLLASTHRPISSPTEGPRSPYIRDVPGEFSTWLERADDVAGGLPEDALDLLRFEWALRAVSYAEDGNFASSADLRPTPAATD